MMYFFNLRNMEYVFITSALVQQQHTPNTAQNNI